MNRFRLDEKDLVIVDRLIKHLPGEHDQKTHGVWADNVADAINRGEHPSIEKENVGAFLGAMRNRKDHPDLTELKVDGTMMFGDEGLGIARKDMPQVPSERRGEFLKDIESSKGITVEAENVDPTTLKPIQKEVSASRSGAIYEKFRKEGGAIPEGERILISKDGYVVDGHHTWGAAVGLSFDSKGEAKLPVYRLSVNHQEALDAALDWSQEKGIAGQAMDAPAPTKKGDPGVSDVHVDTIMRPWRKKPVQKAIKVGDMVSWNNSGGRARGKVLAIRRSGAINVPNSKVIITASQDEPAALITVYDGDKPTKTRVGHKVQSLTLLD